MESRLFGAARTGPLKRGEKERGREERKERRGEQRKERRGGEGKRSSGEKLARGDT